MLLALLVSGCASLPDNVERAPSSYLKNTADTRLGRALEPLVNRHPGESGFQPLIDGINAYAARLLLISEADKTLDLQYYIWHDDAIGRATYNYVLQAADRGVRVRILLDDLDTAGKDQQLRIIDAHPNIEVRLFNPFANRDRRGVDFVSDTARINRRMHNKSLTADNQATIFGGRNIGDEYFDASEEVGFSDSDVLAIGPVVSEVSRAFDLYWNSKWVYPLQAFYPNESIDAAQVRAYRQQSDEELKNAAETDYAAAIRSLEIVKKRSVTEEEFAWSKWKLVYDQPGKIEANEVDKDTHMAPVLKQAMDRTRHELLIVSPYFVPGSDFTQYLVDKVKAGTTVRIMTNSLAANDVTLVHAGYMRYREDLVKGGVELYEFKPTRNDNDEKSKKKWTGSSRSSLHGKYMSFDERYLFVGSFNLDARSVVLNTEMGVFFESPKYARRLSDVFENSAIEKGYRVTLTEDDELRWTTIENGVEVTYTVEPETGFWLRFYTGFMSLIVPESQL